MELQSFLFGMATAFVILLVLASLGIIHAGKIGLLNENFISSNQQADLKNIPEKCKVPAGQDVASWKEHLGHHAETKECLEYFN